MNRSYTRWEEDYQLQDPGRLALFEEYLEMGKFNTKLKLKQQENDHIKIKQSSLSCFFSIRLKAFLVEGPVLPVSFQTHQLLLGGIQLTML